MTEDIWYAICRRLQVRANARWYAHEQAQKRGEADVAAWQYEELARGAS